MPSEYTDVVTDLGLIRVVHEMSLGDAMIFSALALILVFQVVKWIINKIWE
jgi:hypothetical protein